MAFEILDDLTMKIRKGNIGMFTIEDLPEAFNGGTARLVIKSSVNAPDLSAPVNIASPINNKSAQIRISVQDSDALITRNTSVTRYKWGITLSDATGTNIINLIPEDFNEVPDCLVYPEIGGNN